MKIAESTHTRTHAHTHIHAPCVADAADRFIQTGQLHTHFGGCFSKREVNLAEGVDRTEGARDEVGWRRRVMHETRRARAMMVEETTSRSIAEMVLLKHEAHLQVRIVVLLMIHAN